MPLQSTARKTGHVKRVLILQLDSREWVVCDEYYPTDSGRVHVLNGAYYATYDRDAAVFEYKKAAIDVHRVVYDSEHWPTPIAASRDYREILAHFALPDA